MGHVFFFLDGRLCQSLVRCRGQWKMITILHDGCSNVYSASESHMEPLLNMTKPVWHYWHQWQLAFVSFNHTQQPLFLFLEQKMSVYSISQSADICLWYTALYARCSTLSSFSEHTLQKTLKLGNNGNQGVTHSNQGCYLEYSFILFYFC